MSDIVGCAETPLLDLLQSIPLDARAEYEHNRMHHSFYPYGSICHRAANEILRLRAELAKRDAVVEKFLEDAHETIIDYLDSDMLWSGNAFGRELESLIEQLYAGPCPTCQGKGYLYREENRCKKCNGTGMIYGVESVPESITYCQTCGGSGELTWTETEPEHGCGGDDAVCARVCPVPVAVQMHAECPDCKGTGRR